MGPLSHCNLSKNLSLLFSIHTSDTMFRITMLKSAIIGLLFVVHTTDAVEETTGHPVMNRLSRLISNQKQLISHHRRLCQFDGGCTDKSDGKDVRDGQALILDHRRRLYDFQFVE